MHVILLVNGYFSAMRHTSNPTLRSDSLLHMRKLDESFQWRLGITDSGRHKLKVPHKFSRICGAKNKSRPLLGQKKKANKCSAQCWLAEGNGFASPPSLFDRKFWVFARACLDECPWQDRGSEKLESHGLDIKELANTHTQCFRQNSLAVLTSTGFRRISANTC